MPRAKKVNPKKTTKRRVTRVTKSGVTYKTRVKSEPNPFLQNVISGMKNILSPPKSVLDV